ncbi:MAG TPA: SDR family oxidoreductase [Verrucomicrobiota bacterium]|nr:SDR family oxidoreductase [Verrucomicrobiota bacterium]HNU53036.1 SDR family oxidoreductase [Verrucomicrobiota bacterium]
MSLNAVITGAGSGVGRAVACALLAKGWRVALIGRRARALEETAALAGGAPESTRVCPADVGQPNAVADVARRLLETWGTVDALVNAAGTNVPQRSLAELSPADYRALMDTNLNGAYYCVQAFLPSMRQRGAGTIVNVVSDAGKQASPKAGPAYVMSKFGLAGLTQSINAEERRHGIRACAVFPGDIDTPLLDRRPTPPDTAARARMLRPEDVAACILLCLELPPHAIVEELLIRPR